MKKIKHINFEITSKCNQKCIYCFNAYRRENLNDLSFNQIRKILFELKNKNIKSVLFTGGEPFSRKDMIKVLELSLDLGFDTSVLSNGFKISSLVKQHKELFKRLNTIQISLDTLDEKRLNQVRGYSNAHSDAVSAIKELSNNNMKNIEISTVFDKENFGDILHVSKFAHEHNCKLILRSLYLEGKGCYQAKEYKEAVLKVKKKYPNILTKDKFSYVTDHNYTIGSEGKYIKAVA